MREEQRGLDRRGATAVFVAVALAALLGMVALAVDVGMLMKVRADAQRAADAGALAGAQEFLRGVPAAMKNSAALNALEYASRNYVGWKYVDTSGAIFTDSGNNRIANSPEAYVQVITDSQKVRVFIRRATTATWFGHMLGIDFVPITVKAAAQAVNAGTGKCVKPFAIPDLWDDNNDDPNNNDLPDITGQQGKKGGETWTWNNGIDTYYRFQDPGNPNANQWTGYGSAFRNNINDYYSADPNHYLYWNDYGRPFAIKLSNPGDTPSPGIFYPWTMPYDSTNPQAYCDQNGCATPNNGAQWYKWSISHCNPVPVAVSATYKQDSTYLNKPGNMIGPTNQGISDLIAQDPDACWATSPDPNNTGYVTGSVKKLVSGSCTGDYPGWESSPRVAMVPLFSPNQIDNGRKSLSFNNLAVIFIEGQQNAHAEVDARFLFFAKSTGPLAPATGSLIKKLQLVE
ncbi:MAG TPA: pilus assembly protein TadG-related protein [Gemmatimonadales bacterium]